MSRKRSRSRSSSVGRHEGGHERQIGQGQRDRGGGDGRNHEQLNTQPAPLMSAADVAFLLSHISQRWVDVAMIKFRAKELSVEAVQALASTTADAAVRALECLQQGGSQIRNPSSYIKVKCPHLCPPPPAFLGLALCDLDCTYFPSFWFSLVLCASRYPAVGVQERS